MIRSELKVGAFLAYTSRRDRSDARRVLLLDNRVWSQERTAVYRPAPNVPSKRKGVPGEITYGYPVLAFADLPKGEDLAFAALLAEDGDHHFEGLLDAEGRLLPGRLPAQVYVSLIDSCYLRGPWGEAEEALAAARRAEGETERAKLNSNHADLRYRFSTARELLCMGYPRGSSVSSRTPGIVSMPLEVFEHLVSSSWRADAQDGA